MASMMNVGVNVGGVSINGGVSSSGGDISMRGSASIKAGPVSLQASGGLQGLASANLGVSHSAMGGGGAMRMAGSFQSMMGGMPPPPMMGMGMAAPMMGGMQPSPMMGGMPPPSMWGQPSMMGMQGAPAQPGSISSDDHNAIKTLLSDEGKALFAGDKKFHPSEMEKALQTGTGPKGEHLRANAMAAISHIMSNPHLVRQLDTAGADAAGKNGTPDGIIGRGDLEAMLKRPVSQTQVFDNGGGLVQSALHEAVTAASNAVIQDISGAGSRVAEALGQGQGY